MNRDNQSASTSLPSAPRYVEMNLIRQVMGIFNGALGLILLSVQIANAI
jgi:hypothetical protein